MRSSFMRTLLNLMERDSRIVLLTGDLGYTVLEPFLERFQERFFNVGVAEQNMVGLATGLAEAGFIPFIYSIATFVSLRPYEFIRNGPLLHNLPIRIIGIGSGFDYGSAGITHHNLEDVAVMRIHPGITVVVPADQEQATAALLSTWNLPEPIYYRIGKDGAVPIAGLNGRFELGRAQRIGQGKDILIIAMGTVATEVSLAIKTLTGKGIHCTMMVVASVSPAPLNDLAEALSHFKLAMTVEAHYIVGGLGSMVSEVIAEHGLSCKVIRCGVKTAPDCVSGSQSFLYHKHGLSESMLVDAVSRIIDNSKYIKGER